MDLQTVTSLDNKKWLIEPKTEYQNKELKKESEQNEGKNEVKANEVKTNEVKANEVKANEVKANEVKANEMEANEVKANKVKANEMETNGETKESEKELKPQPQVDSNSKQDSSPSKSENQTEIIKEESNKEVNRASQDKIENKSNDATIKSNCCTTGCCTWWINIVIGWTDRISRIALRIKSTGRHNAEAAKTFQVSQDLMDNTQSADDVLSDLQPPGDN